MKIISWTLEEDLENFKQDIQKLDNKIKKLEARIAKLRIQKTHKKNKFINRLDYLHPGWRIVLGKMGDMKTSKNG